MNRRTALKTIGTVSAIGLSGCTSIAGSSDKYTARDITEQPGDLMVGEPMANGDLEHIGIGWFYDGTHYGIKGKTMGFSRQPIDVMASYEFFKDEINIGKGSATVEGLGLEEVWTYRIKNEYSEKEPDSVEYGYSTI